GLEAAAHAGSADVVGLWSVRKRVDPDSIWTGSRSATRGGVAPPLRLDRPRSHEEAEPEALRLLREASDEDLEALISRGRQLQRPSTDAPRPLGLTPGGRGWHPAARRARVGVSPRGPTPQTTSGGGGT